MSDLSSTKKDINGRNKMSSYVFRLFTSSYVFSGHMKLHYLLILTMIKVAKVEVLRFSNSRKFMGGISQTDADPARLYF